MCPLVCASWGDATPKPLVSLLAGTRVLSARLAITTAFNGSAPALTVGDAGNTARLMAATENDPAIIGEYRVSPGLSVCGNDDPNTLDHAGRRRDGRGGFRCH